MSALGVIPMFKNNVKTLNRQYRAYLLKALPDGIVRPHSDPLGNGPVLLDLLGKFPLDTESFVGRLNKNKCG